MVIISEVFPNPAGPDSGKEWIELQNNGSEQVQMSGYKLKDAVLKTFIFPPLRILGPGEYSLLGQETTKISLNNNFESLFLYDGKGNLIDQMEYTNAPPGKSFVRQSKNKFFLSDKPTPGSPNAFSPQPKNLSAAIPSKNGNQFSSDSPALINQSENISHLVNVAIGLSFSLAFAVVFVIAYKKLTPK